MFSTKDATSMIFRIFFTILIADYIKEIYSCDETRQCSCIAPIMDCLNSKTELKLKDIPGNITTVKLKLNHIDKLTNLNISHITDLILRNGTLTLDLLKNAKHLKKLKLQDVNGALDDDIFQGLTHLEDLSMVNIDMASFTQKSFENIRNLSLLDLHNVSNLMPDSFLYFNSFKHLWIQHTEIPSTPLLTDLTIQNIWLKYVTFSSLNEQANQNPISVILSGIKDMFSLDITGMNVTIDKNTFEETNQLQMLILDESFYVNIKEKAFQSLQKLRTLKLASRYNQVIFHKDALKGISSSFQGIKLLHDNPIKCSCQMVSAMRTLQSEHNDVKILGLCYSVLQPTNEIPLTLINETNVCMNSTCNFDLTYPVCYNEIISTTNTPYTTTQNKTIPTTSSNSTGNSTLLCFNNKCPTNPQVLIEDDSGSSLNLIIGLVTACCVLLLIGSFVVWFCMRKKRKNKQKKDNPCEYDRRDYGWKVEPDVESGFDNKSFHKNKVDEKSPETIDTKIHELTHKTTIEDSENSSLDYINIGSVTKERSHSVSTHGSDGTFFYISADNTLEEEDISRKTAQSFGEDITEATCVYEYESSDIESDLNENITNDEDDGYADISSGTESYLEVGTSVQQINASIFDYLNSRIVREFPSDDEYEKNIDNTIEHQQDVSNNGLHEDPPEQVQAQLEVKESTDHLASYENYALHSENNESSDLQNSNEPTMTYENIIPLQNSNEDPMIYENINTSKQTNENDLKYTEIESDENSCQTLQNDDSSDNTLYSNTDQLKKDQEPWSGQHNEIINVGYMETDEESVLSSFQPTLV